MEFNINRLSGIELYYSPPSSMTDKKIEVRAGEANHILKVMRHTTGDEIYITDGKGIIYKAIIKGTGNEIVAAQVIEEYYFQNTRDNIYFCLPRLKSPDRFETALEKSVELGITHFIIYDSERTIPKGNKIERWEKILLSAMKQSLRSYLPDLLFLNSLRELKSMDGKIILLSQEAVPSFSNAHINENSNYYFIFGPEGDLTDEERNLFKGDEMFNLGNYRLRSETAIIKCASML